MFHHSGFHTLSKLWSLFLVTHLGRRCKSRFTCGCEKDSIFIRGLFPSNSCIEKVCIGSLFCCNIYSCPCTSNDLFKFTVLCHTLEETLSDVCCSVLLFTCPLSSPIVREYGEILVSCGLIGEALKIFEDLELWDNLIYCYRYSLLHSAFKCHYL